MKPEVLYGSGETESVATRKTGLPAEETQGALQSLALKLVHPNRQRTR